MRFIFVPLAVALLPITQVSASHLNPTLKAKCSEKVVHPPTEEHQALQNPSFAVTDNFVGCLGAGSNGMVFLAELGDSKKKVSVKRINLALIASRGDDEIKAVLNELDAMKAVQGSPFFPTLFRLDMNRYDLYISMEFIGGESLHWNVTQNGPFDIALCRFYAKQLFLAISYLHSIGYIHGDISTSNIMFTKEGTLKLIDYGYAKRIGNSYRPPLTHGSLQSWAPECRYLAFLTKAVDIWSAGYCLAFMATGRLPFFRKDRDCLLLDVSVVELPEPLRKLIMHQCLQRDSKRRSTASEIVNNPWLRDASGLRPSSTAHLVTDVVFCSDDQQGPMEERIYRAERSVIPYQVRHVRARIQQWIQNQTANL